MSPMGLMRPMGKRECVLSRMFYCRAVRPGRLASEALAERCTGKLFENYI